MRKNFIKKLAVGLAAVVAASSLSLSDVSPVKAVDAVGSTEPVLLKEDVAAAGAEGGSGKCLSGDFDITYTFDNTCNGEANWDNFEITVWTEADGFSMRADAFVYSWGTTLGTTFPAAGAVADSKVVASWTGAYVDANAWAAWLDDMQAGAQVSANIKRTGDTFKVTWIMESENGNKHTFSGDISFGEVDVPDGLFIFVAGPNTAEVTNISLYDNLGTVADVDCVKGWFSEFNSYEITGDFNKTFTFINDCEGNANPQNFVFEIVSGTNSLDLRADAYAFTNGEDFGVTFANPATSTLVSSWDTHGLNWDEWLADMQAGAKVTAVLNRTGDAFAVRYVFIGKEKTYIIDGELSFPDTVDVADTITIKLGGEKARLYDVKVADTVAITNVSASVEKATMNRGEEQQISVVATPENVTGYIGYTYASSDEDVVTVDSTGKITAVGAGDAEITVTAYGSNEKTATVDISVIVKPETLSIAETLNLVIDEAAGDLVAKVGPDGVTEDYTVTYASSDAKVATVDSNGKVTAVAEGTATITATLKMGETTVATDTCKVTVVAEAVPMTSITVDKSEVELYPASEAVKVKVTVNPAENTDNPTITYATSNDKVATVKDGVITPVGAGEATITVTATAGENVKTATVKVKVLEPVVEPEVQAPDNVDVKLNEDEVEENLQLTEEEKAAVDAGAKATLEVAVVDSTKTVEAADKTKIETALKTLTKVVLGKDVKYFDIDVTKVVGNNETALTTLKKAITITVAIPDEWILADNSGRTYKVVRIHDGKAEFLDGTFDAKTKTFAFSTDKFSTYALTYVDAEVEEPTTQEPTTEEPTTQTGGNNNQTDSQPGGDTAPVMMLLAIAAVAGAAVVASKKKNVTE